MGWLDLDTQICFFTDYYSLSPEMLSKIAGKGATYMMAFTDGESTLGVAPVSWSVFGRKSKE